MLSEKLSEFDLRYKHSIICIGKADLADDDQPLSKDHVILLAEKLEDDWKKVAVELNIPEDNIEYWESETSDKQEQAIKMLTNWKVN